MAVKTKPVRIWAVIPVYHPDRKQLIDLLSRIAPGKAVVINNGHDNLRLPQNALEILPKENTGYARGANLGIRKALKNGADWVAVLNQDLKLSQSAWDTACKQMKILSPVLAGPFVGHLDSRRWTTSITESDAFKPRGSFDYVSGSFIIMHRDVIERIGYFYEPYFMYYEDADISVRARNAGIPLQHMPLAGVSHHAYESDANPQKEYYLARNHLLFVRRQAPIGVRLRENVRLPKSYLEHKKRGNTFAIRGILDAYMKKFGPLGGSL